MNLYTIGFTKKSAQDFFTTIEKNNIETLLDIRLNNVSQLAGFTKGNDLKFFLRKICNVEYIHDTELAPTKEILDAYKAKSISWEEYENQFKELLHTRKIDERINSIYSTKVNNLCLLCSEPTSEKCHRRIVAEYFIKVLSNVPINIIHL